MIVTEREELGARLVRLRGKAPLEEVAKALGISTSALSMYEQGKRVPRDEVKIRMADYYQTTVENIFFA